MPDQPASEPFERVSGHRVPPSRSIRSADLPEHDWSAARSLIFPLLQPAGTRGVPVETLREPGDPAAAKLHAEPLVAPGPCGLAVCFGIQADRFDVLVSGEHLAEWGIGSAALEQVALGNLAAWSEKTGWTDESSAGRRLLSSDSGDGYDASRILLVSVREFLRKELAGDDPDSGTRVLIGLPDRHLLVAGSLAADDAEFRELFHEFIASQSEAADEPIDRRMFELVDVELVEYRG